LLRKPKERDQLEDLDIDRTILKCILEKEDGVCELDAFGIGIQSQALVNMIMNPQAP
jgi:hypothetical protein